MKHLSLLWLLLLCPGVLLAQRLSGTTTVQAAAPGPGPVDPTPPYSCFET